MKSHNSVQEVLATLVRPRSEDPFCKKVFGDEEKASFSRFGRPRGAVGHFSRLVPICTRVACGCNLANLGRQSTSL